MPNNENTVAFWLGQQDKDLREKLQGLDNAKKGEMCKRALRVYFANQSPIREHLANHAITKVWKPQR